MHLIERPDRIRPHCSETHLLPLPPPSSSLFLTRTHTRLPLPWFQPFIAFWLTLTLCPMLSSGCKHRVTVPVLLCSRSACCAGQRTKTRWMLSGTPCLISNNSLAYSPTSKIFGIWSLQIKTLAWTSTGVIVYSPARLTSPSDFHHSKYALSFTTLFTLTRCPRLSAAREVLLWTGPGFSLIPSA